MEPKEPKELKRYYIAYVDMLGYKDFFQKHAEQIPQLLNSICSVISDTKDYIAKANQSQILHSYADMNIFMKMYSDNVLLCMEIGETQFEIVKLLTFLSIVADVQKEFVVKSGLFLRGGVTIGEMSFNDDFVFGQGVIDGVEMEEHAIYPRIILSKSIVGFLFQTHYISDSEMKSCIDIVNKAQSGNPISLEEQAFLNANAPKISNELFSSKWKYNLVIEDADGENVLNYLYNLNSQTMLREEQWQDVLKLLKAYFPQDYDIVVNDGYNYKDMLQCHKERVQEKLLEYGKYDDIETSDIKSAEMREKVFKKYLWVMKFHNFIAQKENFSEHMINAQVNCDARFMKMNLGAIQ